ncbi:hypothetical protein AB0L10_43060 [Streptomyces flaveolus]|uniref:hypothetical protein n=1 Tax=Streptomyces flaveolus TaxID=67297 RepID=UPI00342019E2
MTATYTFDVFSTLDGYGSPSSRDWGGYWGKQGPELLDRRLVFPVITGKTGMNPIFHGAADFDLELLDSRTLDGNIQELVYRPTLHA